MNFTARLDNVFFHALLVGCLIATTALGSRYALSVDVTRESRNSLGPHSKAVLKTITEPAVVEVYAGRGSLLVQAGRDLVERYARTNPLVQFKHIDTDRDPAIAREIEIGAQGAVLVKMGERRRRSQALSESAITGALESLMRAEDRRALFVTGHGERDASGSANHHYGEFSNRLRERGYAIASVNLTLDTLEARPGDLLVVASPQNTVQTDELDTLSRYIASGGRVLWLADDGDVSASAIEHLTGLQQLPGVIVDAASDALNLPRPDFAVVTDYTQHDATRGMDGISLFPRAVAFSADALYSNWTATPLLQSTPRSWNETGDIAGRIAPDDTGEQPGPLNFAWSLAPANAAGQLTLIGDGDFLANSWLGNGINLALGERLFDTLSSAAPVQYTSLPARDRHVTLSQTQRGLLGATLFALLPLLLATATLVVWRRQAH